jgi:HPt (histidine-containing phosphotransfer) domain-containing protein
MMSNFLSEMENDVSQIISQIDTRHFPQTLREKVHHAAGSAAMLGAKSLHAALCNLETQLHELKGDNEISGDDLKSTWTKTARELRQKI